LTFYDSCVVVVVWLFVIDILPYNILWGGGLLVLYMVSGYYVVIVSIHNYL
jgi:hypothetical protein